MNDLSSSSVPQSVSPSTPASPVSVTPSGNKEAQSGGIHAQEFLHDATGHETELPKEVVSAGVQVHPTSISIPSTVAQLGVKPLGQNVPVQTVPTVSLPLTDEQIAKGLHENVTHSIRWLAEWCVWKLKRLHIAVRQVHGKLVRSVA
jgi:hypothetical protein